tara:strand:- start:105 stop:695 length:591 start_codon:yes stop_codon:yes gene_type:complete
MNKKTNIRINKVYTKKGDSGRTQLIGKNDVSKSNQRIECYGEVDELNSSLGFCKALIENEDTIDGKKDILESINKIQNELFNLGTMLAVADESKIEDFPSIGKKEIIFLEGLIDSYNKNLSELESFVLPTGSLPGAYFHICRTVCRRVERRCVALSSSEKIEDLIIVYLNRLSDLFFVWARWINKSSEVQEDLWKP